MTMAVRSVVLLLVGFSGLLGMQGCGSMHTITFLSMAAPSVASDEYQPTDQKNRLQRFLELWGWYAVPAPRSGWRLRGKHAHVTRAVGIGCEN